MIEVIGAVIVLLGSLFLLLASIGLIRMPDIYNRMQAGTKATTLGSILVFTGFMIYNPANWSKYILLIVFIFLTNPLSSHALARAAHFCGKDPLIKKDSKIAVRDDYREYKNREGRK